jgi:hypothetical protein
MTRDYKEVFVSGHDPQFSAVKALRRIGVDAKTSIPAFWLCEFQNHADPWVRMLATEALARVSPDAASAKNISPAGSR